jgi:molybdenum cofactor guanylyltransferase
MSIDRDDKNQGAKTNGPFIRPVTGVILAGGLATRYGGINKAYLEVGGRRILDRSYAVYKELFDEIILVTNTPEIYLKYDLTIVTDLFPARSSLAGIHAGLFHATHDHIFVTACDAPFVQKDIIVEVLSRIDETCHCVVPQVGEMLEPLFAVYAKKCLPGIENALKSGQFQIFSLCRKNRMKLVPEKVIRRHDPVLKVFLNVNSPEDKTKADETACEIH